MKSIFSKIIIILVCLLKEIYSGHIYSKDVKTTYNFYGELQTFSVQFMLQSGLDKNEFIQITVPFSFGIWSDVYGSVFKDEQNTLIVDEINADSGSSSPPIYFFQISNILQKNLWHRFVFRTSLTVRPYPNPLLSAIPISMATVSTASLSGDKIIYDVHNAVGLLNVQPRLVDNASDSIATDTLEIQVSTDIYDINLFNPGASFLAFIDITPTIDIPEGGKIVI